MDAINGNAISRKDRVKNTQIALVDSVDTHELYWWTPWITHNCTVDSVDTPTDCIVDSVDTHTDCIGGLCGLHTNCSGGTCG